MKSRLTSNRVLVLAGCLLSIVAVPLLLAATDVEDGVRAERRKQIEEMSASERNRLKRNFERFQNLSEADRERYRGIHRTVEADEELASTLRHYHDWLKTLSPWQREELRKQEDPAARMELIIELRKEQDETRERRTRHQRSFWAGRVLGSNFGRNWSRIPNLGSDDLAAILRVVEENLEFSAEERERLNSLHGVDRHLEVLELVASRHPERLRNAREHGEHWLNEELIQQMLDAVADESLRESLTKRPSEKNQRSNLSYAIVRGLFSEMQGEIESRKATDEELHRFFIELDGEERHEIMRLPPGEQKWRLQGMYLAEHRDEIRHRYDRIRDVCRQVFPDLRIRSGGPPGRGRGRFSDGERGRPGGRSQRNADEERRPERGRRESGQR